MCNQGLESWECWDVFPETTFWQSEATGLQLPLSKRGALPRMPWRRARITHTHTHAHGITWPHVTYLIKQLLHRLTVSERLSIGIFIYTSAAVEISLLGNKPQVCFFITFLLFIYLLWSFTFDWKETGGKKIPKAYLFHSITVHITACDRRNKTLQDVMFREIINDARMWCCDGTCSCRTSKRYKRVTHHCDNW